MNISRRGFLTGMLALGAAPAICKAENLMKVFVPPEKKLIVGRGLTESLTVLDECAFTTKIDLSYLAGDYDGDVLNMMKRQDGEFLIDRAVWGRRHPIKKDSALAKLLERFTIKEGSIHVMS